MRINRRQFLRGAGSAAVLASGHVLAWVPRRARAAVPANPVVVLVQLSGGNDALNTVIPVNNAAAQRSLYDFYRPSLRVAASALPATLIGTDPVNGTSLAFHPVMSGLKSLYDAGHVAVLNGVGVPGAPLSHQGALEAWWAGDPAGFAGTGWLGRFTDAELDAADSPALALGLRPAGVFASLHQNALAAPALGDFALPDDPLHPDLAARAAAWTSLYAPDATDAPLVARIRRAGADVLAKAPLFETVAFSGWGSALEGMTSSSLHRDLLQVASLIRYDEAFPDTASGIALYHVAQPGYDTHARQGAADPESRHPMLLSQLSDALAKFMVDLAVLGVEDRVLVLAYSEFGRRARECGSGDTAGTDHGAAGTVLALGGAVVGGVYGALPDLGALDANGNSPVTVDFRRVYATVIDRFLGADHNDFLPGAPFVPVDFLAAP